MFGAEPGGWIKSPGERAIASRLLGATAALPRLGAFFPQKPSPFELPTVGATAALPRLGAFFLCIGTESGPHSKSNYQADF